AGVRNRRRLGCGAAIAGGHVWSAAHVVMDKRDERDSIAGRFQRHHDSGILHVRLARWLVALLFAAGAARAQPVTVIGPVTPGDIPQFNSTTVIKDSGISATSIFIAPTPVRAGDVIYWNGSAWVTLPGNNSGTNCFSENSSGVPSWAA